MISVDGSGVTGLTDNETEDGTSRSSTAGAGAATIPISAPAATVSGDLENARGESLILASVSAGGDHTCGIRPDRSILCWGGNSYGEAIPPSGEFVSVSAGDEYTCALRPDGSVLCWGEEFFDRGIPPVGEFASISTGDPAPRPSRRVLP